MTQNAVTVKMCDEVEEYLQSVLGDAKARERLSLPDLASAAEALRTVIEIRRMIGASLDR